MVLDALSTFFPQVYDSIHWTICLNASEETLSQDFAASTLERLPESNIACLVFEGGLLAPEGQYLVVTRKGRATFQVQVEGRSAHAGSNHTQGANAIVQIAHTIQKIASFTDYEQQITFNVGTLRGGSVVNRVPHHAEATVEMRAFSPKIFQGGLQKILALDGNSQVSSQDGYPCRASIQVLDQTAPWPRNEGTDRLFTLWSEIGAQLGMQTIEEERGGLSDGNLLWEHFPTLDGLGPSGANAHCSESTPDGRKEQEYVLVPSFVPKAMLNTLAIVSLIEHRR
jgi:glutamate carboxypeptidase